MRRQPGTGNRPLADLPPTEAGDRLLQETDERRLCETGDHHRPGAGVQHPLLGTAAPLLPHVVSSARRLLIASRETVARAAAAAVAPLCQVEVSAAVVAVAAAVLAEGATRSAATDAALI